MIDVEIQKLQEQLVHYIFSRNEPALLDLLEKKNIDINFPIGLHKNDTPLMLCIKYGLENCVNKLLDLGADLNKKNWCRETALHSAITKKNSCLAFQLIDKGTHLHVVDIDNNTLVDVAMHQGLIDVVITLQDLGIRSQKTNVAVIEIGHFYDSTLLYLKEKHITWFSIQLENIARLNTTALVDEINEFNHKYLKDENETLATKILTSPGINIQLIRRYIADILPLLDGIWLTGGEDIPQIFYLDKQLPLPYKDSQNAARTVLELALIERQSFMPELPLVAVCRGLQIFNVAKSGTLLNTKFGHFELHYIDKIAYHGLGAHLIKENMEVQSLHKQGVDKLGHHLEVVAEYDGVVKALQSTQPGSQIFLYQFHPEYNRFEPDNQRLLELLITIFELSKNQQSYPLGLQINKHLPYWQIGYSATILNFQDDTLSLDTSDRENALSICLPKEALPFTKNHQPLSLKNHDINYITIISGLIILFTLLNITKNLFRLTFHLNNDLTRQTKTENSFALEFFKKPSIQTEVTCPGPVEELTKSGISN